MTHPVKSFENLNIWTDGIEGMRGYLQGMKDVLLGLEAGALPDDAAYTPEDLRAYVGSLMKQARNVLATFPGQVQLRARCWCVSRYQKGMSAENWIEFVVFPTALAAATLSRCSLQFPLLAAAEPGLVDVLSGSLTYVASKVPGIRKGESRLDLFDILHLGWVPLLLWENPRLSLPMNRILGSLPHFDFHVSRAMLRRYELTHAAHLEDLRGRRDGKLAWLEQWTRRLTTMDPERRAEVFGKLEARAVELERAWFQGPEMEGDRVSAAGREAYTDQERAALMGYPEPKRLLGDLGGIMLDNLDRLPGLPGVDNPSGPVEPAYVPNAPRVARPLRVPGPPQRLQLGPPDAVEDEPPSGPEDGESEAPHE